MKNRKVYLIVWVLIAFIQLIFVYLANRVLENSVYTQENLKDFYHYHGLLTKSIFIGFLILWVYSNFLYFKHKIKDPFFYTLILLIVFTIIDWWWLSEKVYQYKKNHDLLLGESNLGPFIGVFIVLIGSLIIFGNLAMLKKLSPKNANTGDDNNPPEKNDTVE
ncbi:MAG: hypothetical protein H6605_03155 [Flavobacteriales bacterium]|nr:hypothetical protein [Flavobacteriales bacterium]